MLVDKHTDYQHLQIFDTTSPAHGRVMTLDGIVQVSTGGDLTYLEYIATLPVFVHGDVKRVLVIGAGDGGVIRQLFRFKTIEQVTMVEIDREVTFACAQHMPTISHGAFKDSRLDLRFMDARDFVEDCTEEYDLIIVDSTDPIGPGANLFKADFYERCHYLLNHRGILVTQNGVPRFQDQELVDSIKFMGTLFEDATCYLGTMFDYPGAQMAFGFASDFDYRSWPLGNIVLLEQRLRECGFRNELHHINADTIQAAFALPPYVKRLLKQAQ